MISDGCDLMTNVDEVMAVMLTKLMWWWRRWWWRGVMTCGVLMCSLMTVVEGLRWGNCDAMAAMWRLWRKCEVLTGTTTLLWCDDECNNSAGCGLMTEMSWLWCDDCGDCEQCVLMTVICDDCDVTSVVWRDVI
jgi:hypothetical protein